MLDLLNKRRSIRQFQCRPIEKEKRDLILEAALRSPSSRNFTPWEFIVVSDPQRMEAISRAKEHGSAFLKGAPLAVVVCADPEKSDVWIEDCSIAAILIQMTAQSLGLGCCWVQIRRRMHDAGKSSEEYLKQLLDIPERFTVEAIIGIGYPDEVKPGHPKESLQFDKLHFGRFGNGEGGE